MTLPRDALHDLGILAEAGRRAAEGDASALPEAEERLLARATFGATAVDRARIATVGYEAWLDEQLDFERLDDSALEEALHASLPSLGKSAGQLFADYADNPFPPIYELWLATLYRAIYSPRQLFERMATFWSDHFSIDVFADYQYLLKPVDNREVVRSHALGSFPDMLRASAHSPSMLIYLNNETNFKGNPNENYARELMELHSLGADNGYDQDDVREVARCFTGWTFIDPYRSAQVELIGSFRFNAVTHDNGAKKVLGRNIAAGGGMKDGERVLDILAKHRNTGAFIGTKMLRYLWGYEPDQESIHALQRVYKQTRGDIRSMVRACLSRDQLASSTVKIKRPFHLMVAALRALGADVRDAGWTLEQLSLAGQLPFAWSPPNGYPDDPVYWTGLILPRWNFGFGVTDEYNPYLELPAAVTSTQGTEANIVGRIDALLFGGRMSDATRTELLKYLTGKKNARRVRETIALALAAPAFQEY